MNSPEPVQSHKGLKYGGWCITITGVILVICAITVPIVTHRVLERALDKRMIITSSDSIFYERWASGMSDCEDCSQWKTKYWVYNLTNAEEVLNGASPRFEEKGPYVYHEHRRKINISYVETAEDLMWQYTPKLYYTFDPDASNGLKEEDMVTVPSAAFWLVELQGRNNPSQQEDLLKVMDSVGSGSSPFVTLTVYEAIYEFNSTLVAALAKHFTPTLPPPPPIKLVNNHTNDETAYDDQGTWWEYSGKDEPWNLRSVKRVHGTHFLDSKFKVPQKVLGTDGTLYRMHLGDRAKKEGLMIYEDQLRRTVNLEYVGDEELHGVKLWRYHLNPNDMANSTVNPANDQYYMTTQPGVAPMTLAVNGVPVWLSMAHFLGGEYWYEKLGGEASGISKATFEDHDVDVRVEPFTGVGLDGRKRIQLNLMLNSNHTPTAAPGNCSWTKRCGKLPPNILYPLFWAQEEATADEKTCSQLKTLFSISSALTSIFPIAGYTLGFLALILGPYMIALNARRTHNWVGWQPKIFNSGLYKPLDDNDS